MEVIFAAHIYILTKLHYSHNIVLQHIIDVFWFQNNLFFLSKNISATSKLCFYNKQVRNLYVYSRPGDRVWP